MRAALVLAALAGTAAADPLELRESTLREPALDVQRPAVRLTWRADAIAATAGARSGDAGAREDTASVSAELAITRGDCDLVLAGGQVDARTGSAPYALQQWASVCPVSGMARVQIAHRLIWDVTPRLLAPPRLRPGGNRRETVGIDVTMLVDEWPADDAKLRERVVAAVTHVDVGLGWVGDRQSDLSASVDFDALHYQRERAGRPTLHLRVAAVHLELIETFAPMPALDVTAHAMRLDLARVDGLELGGYRLGGAVGFGEASVDASDRMIDRGLGVVVGRIALSAERDVGRVTARVAAARDLWPTWDGRAVIDDRVTAGVAAEVASLRGRVEASLARVGLVDLDSFERATVGGVAAIAERDLGRHLTARGHVELGRSGYAAGATFEQPRWAGVGMLSLQLHAGNR